MIMDTKITVWIEDLKLNLYESLINKACDKYNVHSPEEVALIYVDKLIGEEESDSSLRRRIEVIQKMAKYYEYETVSSMLTEEMIPDLRPDDEICLNCGCYSKGICTYRAATTSPFDKGCKGWEQKYDDKKVTLIAEGYVRYRRGDLK